MGYLNLDDETLKTLSACMVLEVERQSDALSRRLMLRRFATERLENHSMALKDAMNESPLIGPGPLQVKLRNNTVAALRDSLTTYALLDVVGNLWSNGPITRIVLALRRPKVESAKSSKSKTGYALGEHVVIDLREIFDRAEKTVQEKSRETPASQRAFIERHAPGLLEGGAKKGGQTGTENEAQESEMETTAQAGPALPTLDPAVRGMLDAALKSANMPSVQEMADILGQAVSERDAAKAAASEATEKMQEVVQERADELAKLRKELAKAKAGASQPVVMEASGGMPSGRTVTVNAADVFDMPVLKFEVPAWEWDGKHPDVPEVDENYVFREAELEALLDALANNEVPWLTGHTGTGKTSLVEQVCARLNWPFVCVSLDGHVTRGDLLGGMTLKVENGATVSEWVDGIIVRALEMGAVLCLDELDAVSPDTSYTVQRPLEKRALKLLEDGGREVVTHPMSRIVATGNTVGQGDETGQYPATRPQSMAFLGRFGAFIEIDYLNEDERRKLIGGACPGLDDEQINPICAYLTEHIEAFKQGQIMLPTSPRDYLSMSRRVERLVGQGVETKTALSAAFRTSVYWRASQADRPVLLALAQRAMGIED